MAYLEIEIKEDSPAKVAQLVGVPSKNYLKATEFNDTVAAINNLDERVSASSNAILVNTGFSIIENAFVLSPNTSWKLSGTIYTNPALISEPIQLCDSGLVRQDIVVLNNQNTIEIVKGQEVVAFPTKPSTPTGTLFLTDYPVSDSAIGNPSIPIIGDAYLKKTTYSEIILNSSGVTALSMDSEYGGIRFLGSNTSFECVFFYNTAALVNGATFSIKNTQLNEMTLKHLTGSGVQFFFPDECDFILQRNQIAHFEKTLNQFNVWRLEYVGSYPNYTPQKTIFGNTTLDNSFNGAIVKIKSNATITVPTTLKKDFSCVFRTWQAVTATFSGGVGVTMDALSGSILEGGKMATLFKDGNLPYYVLEGGLKL